MRKWIDIGYLMILGMSLGMVVALGAIVAPVVFHADHYSGAALSHYQMGLVMTEIFVRAGYWLNVVALLIIVREAYDYKRFLRDRIIVPAAGTAVLMIFLFTLYYTKAIVAYQAKGASVVEDPKFAALHKASELDFGLLALSLALLLGRRLYLCMKG
jgi:hypothetical protein